MSLMGAGQRFVVAIVCVAACVSAAPASAQTTTFRPRVAGGLGLVPPVNSQGQMVTTDVASGGVTPLTYHGGAVMGGGVTVHTIFWAPSGYSFQGSPGGGVPTYIGLIQQFFTDVAHDSGAPGTCTNSGCNVFTTLPQFGQGTTVSGVSAGSYSISYSVATDSVSDTNPYPAASDQCPSPGGVDTCITDAQLRTEIDRVVQSTPGTPRGLKNLWFVFLPPSVDACITRTECGTNALAGYHSVSNVNGHGVTIYALSIDPIIETPIGSGSDPQGYPDAEATVDIAAHETVEAITDPEGTGWMDPNGGEAGDKCVTPANPTGTPLGFDNGSPYNQVINGHHYLLQEMWANQTSRGNFGCAQSTTDSTVQLPLPQVNMTQFSSTVTGNVNRSSGGGIGVQVTLLRADVNGSPVVVARASTTTAADGSWSVSLAPHAVGDDRDEIDVDYSGANAPQPHHQVILTGNGANPFIEAGWTGWLDLDIGSATANQPTGSSLTLAPCFQSGLLGYSFDGALGAETPTDFCNTQTDAATISTGVIEPKDVLTATSNDNRAFSSPAGSTPNPLGGLVSLTVPVGEVGSVSAFTHPLAAVFTPGGLPSCTADLEFQAVLCTGLVSGASYSMIDGGQTVTATADSTGTAISPLRVAGGDSVALTNGVRTLTTLHVAHLRVAIVGEQTAVIAGSCEPGDYFGAPLSSISLSTVAGLPTSDLNGGMALTGQVCPTNGDATGLPTAAISQTDDRSGGQTETEVPDIQDTSPMEGETMYGKFTALAESGLAAPGGMTVPTDLSTRISVQILTAARGQAVFAARNVDTLRGVAVPALKPGSYFAIWTLKDANGDRRLVATRFIEQAGQVERAPKAKVTCAYTSTRDRDIRCGVSFPGQRFKGTVRLRLTRGGVVVGLGHAAVRRGRATVTLKVLRQVSSGGWLATLVLARPHLATATRTVSLSRVG
jgi:hypothetical protein